MTPRKEQMDGTVRIVSKPAITAGAAVPFDNDNKGEDGDESTHPLRPLNRLEIWNLCFSLLAWACTVCNVTLVVGTSAVVVLSIDPDASDLTSVPLGAFMVGSSAVSLLTLSKTHTASSRKHGFLLGIVFSVIGTLLGLLAVGVVESVGLLIVATFAFGMATGIGFVWRFAAVEVVPTHYAARAVTLVVSGGCLAAFVGPESARATKDSFDQEYLGVFVMMGVFTAANLVFTLLVQFPNSNDDASKVAENKNNTLNVDLNISDTPPTAVELPSPSLVSLLLTRQVWRGPLWVCP